MKTPDKRNGRIHTSPLLLTGMLYCGYCGSSMVSSTAKGGRYTYYLCSRTKKSGVESCKGHRLPAKTFEENVIAELLERAFSFENVKSVAKEIRKEIAERRKPIQKIKKAIKEIDEKLQRYYEAFETGALEVADVAERLKSLKQDKVQQEIELRERLSIDSLPKDVLSKGNIEALQDNLKALFATATPAAKKQWLQIILEKIVITGDDVMFHGSAPGLLALAEHKENARTGDIAPVRASSNLWQPVGHIKYNWIHSFKISLEPLQTKVIRFDAWQVSQWLEELLAKFNDAELLVEKIGISSKCFRQYVNQVAY